MAQTVFVTGATGFIGSRVVRKLCERGDTARCLVRRPSQASWLHKIGAKIVVGDIRNRVAMREGMKGCDVVYHIAAWYEIGVQRGQVAMMKQLNVTGAYNVLSMAYHIGIPKIVYTSTASIFGDTRGVFADETYQPRGALETVFAQTKSQAHYEVALPLIEEGAPIIIVMPGAVYGPGDPSLVGQVIKMHVKRRLPVMIGGNATYSWVYVDDVAEGHLLAADKGKPGESYILAGPPFTVREVLQMCERITNIPAPKFVGGSKVWRITASTMGRLEKYVPLPALIGTEALMNLSEGTHLACDDKARRELGWNPRPPEEGLQMTLDWYMAQYDERR